MSTDPSTADLRVRREALGLSRAWVAERLGVAEQSVSRWENGSRAIPDDVWEVLDEGERRAESTLDAVARELPAVEIDLGEGPESLDVVVYPTDAALWAAHPEFAPWPASWHRMVCGRIRDLTESPVRFHYGPSGP